MGKALSAMLLLVSQLAVVTSAAAFDAEMAALLQRAGIRPIEPPSAALDLTLPAVDGGEVTLSQLGARWQVLTFWASWCQPCVAEMPTLMELQRTLDERELRVVAVSIDQDREAIRRFLDRHQLDLPVLWDRDGRAARGYRATSIPVSYLIDASGRIVGLAQGARDWSLLAPMFSELTALGDLGSSDSLPGDFDADEDAAGGRHWDAEQQQVSLPIRLTPPRAEVSLSSQRLQVDDPFTLSIRVHWAGDFEEYLPRAPVVALPEGIEQLGVSAQTGSETGRSVVTYEVRLKAHEAGTYALDPVELRYVPRFEQEPVSSLVDGPEVEVVAARSYLPPISLAASAAAGLALALVAWRRRRRGGEGKEVATGEEVARASWERARRLRLAGEPHEAVGELYQLLLGVADAPTAETSAEARELSEELAPLVERCRFAGFRPDAEELDRLFRRVGRLLDGLSPTCDESDHERLEIRTDPTAGGRAPSPLRPPS